MSKIQEIKQVATTNVQLIKDTIVVSQKMLTDLVKMYPMGVSMYNRVMGEADYITMVDPTEFSLKQNLCQEFRLTGFDTDGFITYLNPESNTHHRCLISEVNEMDAPYILIFLVNFLTPIEN